MNIDLLASPHFHNYRIDARRSIHNTGGGMSVLINAIQSTLMDRYAVKLCGNISELSAPVCFVETCFFASNIHDADYWGGVEQRLQEFQKYKDTRNVKVVLICAEITLLRMLPKHRKLLLDAIDVLTVTDPYLKQILKALDILPQRYLCDAIDPTLFRPAEKEMSVIAVGGLKYIKNVDWIIEIFKRLEGKMKRIYLGSAAVWSDESRPEDLQLIPKIKQVTDAHYSNASSVEVAYHNARAAFAVCDTWHDCSCRANEELLMSGVISIHGQHPLFDPRPGFRVKTPEEAVAKIAELTNDFTQMPDPALHQASRNWALQYVSTQTFMTQFETLMRNLL